MTMNMIQQTSKEQRCEKKPSKCNENEGESINL